MNQTVKSLKVAEYTSQIPLVEVEISMIPLEGTKMICRDL
jgi:hypothetical protein